MAPTTVPAASTKQSKPRCEAPAVLARFTAPLPKFTSALLSTEPIRLVALGSSSTQGIGASSPKTCYPVRLEAELKRRFPERDIAVDNLGVAGELATDMVRRIKTQVLPRRPTLVVWQTGVNDAVRQVNVEKFRATVLAGLDLLKASGTDVVLLDMQYFPRAAKIKNFARYLAVMQEVAKDRRVPLLQRYAIMQHMITSEKYTPQQLLASDLFHPNDFSYDCLGTVLANALQEEVLAAERAKDSPSRIKQAGEVPSGAH